MAGNKTTIFYSTKTPLHEAVAAAFAGEIDLVFDQEALNAALDAHGSGLVLLDAEYGTVSGYSICEEIKARHKDQWRVHLMSNETSLGEGEKADYARVDRLFIVPLEMGELTQYE